MRNIIFLLIPLLILSKCGQNDVTNNQASNEVKTSDIEENNNNVEEKVNMELEIDNKKIDVNWDENPSVKALNNIKPLEISMHRYGGFEQVGSIKQTIVSNDVKITTSPGDIVLYSSNQIVVFFGSNTWQYTKLGHINMNNDELNNLLNKENVTFKIS